MKIRATRSFAGVISMHKGQILDCSNKAVVQDLLRCGYVEKVNPKKEENEVQDEVENAAENGGGEDETE